MSAHVVGHIAIKHAEKWAEYLAAVPLTLEPWGAEIVTRGKLASIYSGEHDFTDIVVIRFPRMEAANNWHSSSAYQAIIPLRMEAADVTLLSYES